VKAASDLYAPVSGKVKEVNQALTTAQVTGTVDAECGCRSKITTRVTDALVEIGRFSIVERSQLAQVLQELSLGQAGLVDPAQARRKIKILIVAREMYRGKFTPMQLLEKLEEAL
jgi:curli biogenesis system outer membrane secretion channel CsgG